jgi:hypothetical protein
VSKKIKNELLDFDCRVSQVFKLPYGNYSGKDSDALKLLSLLDKSEWEISHCPSTKEITFTVYGEDRIIGASFKSLSIKDSIILFFKKQIGQ